MAVRRILLYPKNETVLRQQSKPVQKIDADVKQLIGDLRDTLNAHHEGIGLSAPQIGVHRRVVIVRLGNEIEGEWHPDPVLKGPDFFVGYFTSYLTYKYLQEGQYEPV